MFCFLEIYLNFHAQSYYCLLEYFLLYFKFEKGINMYGFKYIFPLIFSVIFLFACNSDIVTDNCMIFAGVEKVVTGYNHTCASKAIIKKFAIAKDIGIGKT